MANVPLRRFCFLIKFLPAFYFRAKTRNCCFLEESVVYCQSFVLQKASFSEYIPNTIMPPRRKVESKKVEKMEVEVNDDAPLIQKDVKPKGRGKKADNPVKPDKVVEEVEEIVPAAKARRGQKKEAVPMEEPKTRSRKVKAEKAVVKELEAPPVSKESSPAKRGRKNKTEEAVEEDIKDEPPTKKVTKKNTKPTKATKAQEEVLPVKATRGRQPKAAAVKDIESEGDQSEEETDAKKKNGTEKNITETNYENIDFSACEKNSKAEVANMKIATWNIGGIRAWLKKDGLQYIVNESPDILCLQETKCSEKKVPEDFVSAMTEGSAKYHMYWLDGEKDGYAGVAMFTRTKPLSVSYGIGSEDMDKESRCITAHFDDYYVVTVYVPNAGRGLITLPKRLEWNEAFRTYVNALNKDKPVIICGDMNVAHNEIDLKNPKTNKKNAGFTPEERDGMTTFLGDGFVDVYRHLYPEEKDCYTFWSYMSNARNKNVGWRLDYYLVSERFMENICDTKIRSSIYGSDHCPITLHFNCD